MTHFTERSLIIAAAMLPMLLTACVTEPNSDYISQYPAADHSVKVYSETTAVTAPATSYYDESTDTTVYVSPTITTTSAVGPATVTYEDDDGFWHNTYDVRQ